jgi:uncharacterized protein (DUF924 family)
MNNHGLIEVLWFWLGSPATTGDGLMSKIRRWYQGGPELDREIEKRFGDVIERALTGGLGDWENIPRGRLALVIVLDQLARNVHRGTPRAYAGDARARELALGLIEGGHWAEFNAEEQLFTLMPLVHAEDLALQDRAVELADRMVEQASSEELRAAWALGAARTRHYRDIVRRFGRFPHRNAILGRASTAQELAFLAAEAQAAGPLPAAQAG